MASTHNLKHKHLPDTTPPDKSSRQTPRLELVRMPLGEVYFELGGSLPHIDSPTVPIVSLCYLMESGASVEIAVVGNRGMRNIPLLMGTNTSDRACVYATGSGYQLKAQQMAEELNQNGALQRLWLSYRRALVAQISQTMTDNHRHPVEQQLCRWLLLTMDRLSANEHTLTQASDMLGVQRDEVTEAANKLQQSGFIRNRRGHVTVLDRSGLADYACECYDVGKAEFKQLLENGEQKLKAVGVRGEKLMPEYILSTEAVPYEVLKSTGQTSGMAR